MQNNGHPPPPYPGTPAPGYPQYPPQTTTAMPPGYPPPSTTAMPPGYPPPSTTAVPPGYPPPPPGYGGYPPSGYSPPRYPPSAPQGAPGYGRPGIMSGMDDVEPTGSRLPNFNAILPPPGSPPGTNGSGYRYLLRNEKIEFFQGRQSPWVVSDWHILESDDPALAPGRDAKHMLKWGQDMSLPNFKALVGALEGLTDQEQIKTTVTEQKALDAIDQQKQPYKGRVLELRTIGTITKQGKQFTIHNWSPASVPSAGLFGGASSPAVTPSGHYVPPHAAPMAPPLVPYVPPQPQHVAPPAPFPPPGWFAFPAGDPRVGSFYNQRGETVPEHELRARVAQGRA